MQNIHPLPHTRFEAWHASKRLYIAIHESTGKWPKEHQFGLTAQVRRAAFSVAANLAEGSARRGSREFRRFLDISLASLAELACALDLAEGVKVIGPDERLQLDTIRDQAGKLIWGLSRSLANGKAELKGGRAGEFLRVKHDPTRVPSRHPAFPPSRLRTLLPGS